MEGCFLIGLAIGAWVSYTFIFPNDVLSIKLAALTIGDVLRIFGGVILTIVMAIIGGLIGSVAESYEKK